MKLMIFTPTSKTSAIGRMASLVTRALLSQGHDLTVVRTEAERFLDTPSHDFGVGLIPWNDFQLVIDLASRADALVYQVGNSYEFHQGCLEWLPKLPGLVCLHDFFLGHLFHAWAESHRQQADEVLRNWYGAEAATVFWGYICGETFLQGTRDVSPLTEWICSMAHGVVTHSGWGTARVLSSCPGPVHIVPLAYDAPAPQTNIPCCTDSESGLFQLLTIGHINSNKRVASVIRAIGKSTVLRQRTVYRLIGKIQPEAVLELSALARACRVSLLISGEVDDATLGVAVQQADAISCLRWPSLEAASASAIEAMLYGKPIVVTNVGFYAEIPSACALKISHDNEINDLQSALEQLATDPERREGMGKFAKQWAAEQFSAENYAVRLTAFVTDMLKAEPPIKAINYFSDVIERWSGRIDILSETSVASMSLFDAN